MDTPGRPTRRQSLEDEVRAYFMEPPYSFGSVRYWQVMSIHFFSKLDLNWYSSGKPTTARHYIRARRRHLAHSRVSCPMRARLLF
jgi:hypothetical protein